MRLKTRFLLALCLGLGAALLAACQSAATPAVPLTRVTTPATPTAVVAATSLPASPLPSATLMPPADTPTVAPSGTPTSAATASPTSAPTTTRAPDTPTATATTADTATAPPTRTRAPIISATATVAAPALFSTTGGPAGYSSRIQCQRVGAPCAPVMPPGDLSFQLVLASDTGAPWTHFVNYGLSVEKDGANAADLFMFVDAGWLQPGAVVSFGASRRFSLPGTYVIRSSGCLTTDTTSNNCAWQTIAGDVLTFVIQP